MAPRIPLRLAVFTFVFAACGPTQTTATAPSGPAPSLLVRSDSGLNALANDACGRPCAGALPEYAREVGAAPSGARFMSLEPSRCNVPGFLNDPVECVATCDDSDQVSSFSVDFGPVGVNALGDLCRAIERDRGTPARGECNDVCESAAGCAWGETDGRGALQLRGHVALQCASSAGLEPNHSDASNSMSP